MDVPTHPRWVPRSEYEFICERVPIVCVDLLPLLADGKFGLIERGDTPDGTPGLNLVGGAVLLDESLTEALDRHVRWTLGEGAKLNIASLEFVGVYQYFKARKPGELHDPRKSAVALTYTGVVAGSLEASEEWEARNFYEFDIAAPPEPERFGWEQGPVVHDALATVRSTHPRI